MPIEALVTFEELRDFWKDPDRRRHLPELREEDGEMDGTKIAVRVQQSAELLIDLAIWLRSRDDRLWLGRWGMFTPDDWDRQIVGPVLLLRHRG